MTLRCGDLAPDFRARNQHGQPIELSTVGSPVLLFFYPFAFTTVCASELQALRSRAPDFRSAGVRVLALSCDSPYALRVFGDSEGFEADLISDFWPHGEIATAYGVFDDERGCARRGSFLVDGDQRIRWTTQSSMGEARDVEEHLRRATDLFATDLLKGGLGSADGGHGVAGDGEHLIGGTAVASTPGHATHDRHQE